jgi:hypothetical protein
VEGMLIE